MKKLTTLFATTFLVMLVGIQGCKKDNDGTSKPNLILTKSALAPLEIAVIQADNNFSSAQTFNAKLDGENVTVFLMDSNRLGFITPMKAASNYSLNLETDVFSTNKIDFSIAPYTPITNPDQQITQFVTNIDSRQTELNNLQTQHGWTIDPQHLTEIEAMQTALQQAIATATPQEKEQLAYFIQSNNLLNHQFQTADFIDSFYAKAAVDPGDELYKIGKQFAGTMIISFTTAAVLGNLLTIPELSFTKLAALAAGVTLAVELVYAKSLIDRLANIIGAANDFDFNSLATFTPSLGVKFIDKIKFRNLLSSDISAGGYIKTIVEKAELFEKYWNNLRQGFTKIRSWFSSVPEGLSGAASKLKSTTTFKTFYAKQEYISVENVSNSAIDLKIIVSGGEAEFKVTSSLTQATQFTFDVVYRHPLLLGVPIRKTISAKYEPGNALIGLWKCVTWVENGQNRFDYTESQNLTFDCQGTPKNVTINFRDVVTFMKWNFTSATSYEWIQQGQNYIDKYDTLTCAKQTDVEPYNDSESLNYILNQNSFTFDVVDGTTATFEWLNSNSFKIQEGTKFHMIFERE